MVTAKVFHVKLAFFFKKHFIESHKVLPLYGIHPSRYSLSYLLFFFTEEKKLYRFGKTWLVDINIIPG